MRSPAVSSMSSSRAGGSGETSLARSIRSSVVSPIAETTTTTLLPAFLVSTIRRATRLMLSASATEEPPYFCTTMPTAGSLLVWLAAPGDDRPAAQDSGQPRFYRLSEPVPGDVQHRVDLFEQLGLALDVQVEPGVRDDRMQRGQHTAGVVAPRSQVGELPPPERFLDVAGAEVSQSVGDVGRDQGEVVGDLRRDRVGVVGLDVVGVGVQLPELVGEAHPHRVQVG